MPIGLRHLTEGMNLGSVRFGAALAAFLLMAGAPTVAGPIQVVPATSPTHLAALPVSIGGRVARDPAEPGTFKRQWPGTYFETRFIGWEADFKVGSGDVILDVLVDGALAAKLTKPAPGSYAIKGLAPGTHSIRVEVVSESQSNSTAFGGFFGSPAVAQSARKPRQIEFIGDSYTVGYGNTSTSRDCTADQVWLTTDTSQGLAVQTAKRFGADYQVNAISGRGIVRNYNGFAADALPQAYPFALFDKREIYNDPAWRPQLIVVGLGGNDFSTPLHAGEKWKSREELRSDYESTYLEFLKRLRGRNPSAFFILMSLDNSRGEIESEVSRVAQLWRSGGETRVAFVPLFGTAMTGCHWHPSTADDALMAKTIGDFIEAHPEIWASSAERG
jgi:lysophospholipase L1-like esterase